MMRAILLTLAIAAAPACAGTLTCETHGDIRHCRDEHGDTVVTEERSGEYVHGHDNRGGAWTTWPTRSGVLPITILDRIVEARPT